MTENLLNHPLISSRYFYPVRESFAKVFWVKNGEFKLSCFYHHKASNPVTILFFHGNGESCADYLEDFFDEIKKLKVNFFIAEYRGYGLSDGEASLFGIFEDLKLFAEALKCNFNQLIVMGRSIGSIFALEFVKQYPLTAGLILESSVSQPYQRLLNYVNTKELGCSEAELKEACDKYLDHFQKIISFYGHTLVLHCQNDDIVDIQHGNELYEWANDPKRARFFERGHHNNIMFVNKIEYYSAINEMIRIIESHNTPTKKTRNRFFPYFWR